MSWTQVAIFLGFNRYRVGVSLAGLGVATSAYVDQTDTPVWIDIDYHGSRVTPDSNGEPICVAPHLVRVAMGPGIDPGGFEEGDPK